MFDLGHGRRGVYTVTDAKRPMSEDISYRQKRYLIMMGVRVVGLVLAVFLFHGVWRFVAAAVAIVMPYFAVVFANGGREPDNRRFEPYDPERRQIPASSADEASSPGQFSSPDESSSGDQASSSGRDSAGQDSGGRSDGEGSLSAEEAAADHASQSRTRSNRA